MIPVELTPEVHSSLRAMSDRGTAQPRCHEEVIKNSIAGAERRLFDGTLPAGVRPWDLPALQRRAAELGEVSAARAVAVDEDALVGRSILAEEVKNEIYDGATPSTSYVRGVIVEGDRGVLLTGRGDTAMLIEG